MKDQDYIKNRFEEDGLDLPQGLETDNLRARIKVIPQEETAGTRRGPMRRPWAKPALALAACACIAIVMIPMVRGSLSQTGLEGLDADSNGLYHFTSYKQLNKTVETIVENDYVPSLYMDGSVDMAITEDAESPAISGAQSMDNGAQANSESAGKTAAGPDHSSTYTQVEGVDEADIVKTDGDYIYHVSAQENQVIITRAKDGKTKRLSAAGDQGDSLISDIYVESDRLIIVSDTRTPAMGIYGDEVSTAAGDGGDSAAAGDGDSTVEDIGSEDSTAAGDVGAIPGCRYSQAAAVTVYDISDRTAPKALGRYTQSGSLVSSRMTGGNILLVTDQPAYSYDSSTRLPSVSYDGEEPKQFDVEDICCIPEPASPSYTVIGLIDPSDGKLSEKKTRTRAVLGGSDQIYCNTNELYVAATSYDVPSKKSILPFRKNSEIFADFNERTQILRVTFGDGKLKYRAVGYVEGWVNDQFSMDSSDGLFKIATTSNWNGEDVNNLFVLDDKLKEVGSLRNFARDEHIEAVRYIGKYAYVITYEQTDPLFIIDLSKPSDPVIRGHVKISGFSTLLVPTDTDHILGFGFSTETTEGGEATDGLKLALFDVSDPDDPRVADSKAYVDVSSPIQYDHKALLMGPKGSYYAIPYDCYTSDWTDDDIEIIDEEEPSDKGNGAEDSGSKGNTPENENGIMVFDASKGKVRLIKDLPSKTPVNRCIYIGDWIYGIADDDNIEAFKL